MNLALCTLVLLSSPGSANDGPPAAMWVMQQGDGVQITLKLYDDGKPGMSDSFDLVRRQGGEETSVLEGRGFQVSEATDIGEAATQRKTKKEMTREDQSIAWRLPRCAWIVMRMGLPSATAPVGPGTSFL